MRLRMRATGTQEVKLFLQNIGKRTTAAIRDEMVMTANDTAELAMDMTPEDVPNLVNSIRVKKQPSSSHRFYVTVEAGGIADDGTDVSEYAAIVHENYESYATGEESAARRARKERQNGGLQVGSKFLERALDMVDQNMAQRLGRVLTLIGGYER